ncbi:MAG: hypothetical protein ACXADY_08025 [Candidatus Hodarchaeales archaeon]
MKSQCEKCQTVNVDGALFCFDCGHYLRAEYFFSWHHWFSAYQIYLLEAKKILSEKR